MLSFGFAMLLLILGYVMILALGIHGVKTLFISLGAKNRLPIDISHLQTQPPTKLQAAIYVLLNLGFSRLGESSTNIFGSQGKSWIFISPDKSTTAELVVAAPILLSFTTIYNDTAVVETGFPVGERIETPYYKSHTIKSSIEKAYNHQVQQMTNSTKAHGAPCRIENMHDYLYWDVVYRKEHVLRKFSRLLWTGVLYILLLGCGVLSTLIVTGFFIQGDDLTIEGLYNYLMLLFNTITPIAFISSIIAVISTWSSNRETKPA
jgi:hypothetical protein